MSVLDFVTGHWTWHQLLGEIAPLLVAVVPAYFAGYMYGRRVEAEELELALESKTADEETK